jgi:hypothetical protein
MVLKGNTTGVNTTETVMNILNQTTVQHLKLYLLTQDESNGYDTFDSCVVAAYNEEDAKRIHPFLFKFDSMSLPLDIEEYKRWNDPDYINRVQWDTKTWASSPYKVNCKLIGIATEDVKPNSVICTSYNAG